MSMPVNCNAAFTYQVDIQTPVAATGDLGTPALGVLTGIKVRLSLTPTGVAINGSVGALVASERASKPGRFYYDVSQALQQAYLLPLGVGIHFYAIWSNAAGFDMDYTSYFVSDRMMNS
jgi:hypothetical protein